MVLRRRARRSCASLSACESLLPARAKRDVMQFQFGAIAQGAAEMVEHPWPHDAVDHHGEAALRVCGGGSGNDVQNGVVLAVGLREEWRDAAGAM